MYYCRAYGAVWKEEFGAFSNVEEGNGRLGQGGWED